MNGLYIGTNLTHSSSAVVGLVVFRVETKIFRYEISLNAIRFWALLTSSLEDIHNYATELEAYASGKVKEE